MAADKSRTVNQALVIHDPRISMDTFDATNSTVTQTGPQAGVPEPSVVTQMALQATGEQTEAITVFTAQAGGDDAAWGWRDNDGVDYYWDGPTTVRQVRSLELTSVPEDTYPTSSVLYKGKIVTLAGVVATVDAYNNTGKLYVTNISGVQDETTPIVFTKESEIESPFGGAIFTSLIWPLGALCVMPNGKLHAYIIGQYFTGTTEYWTIDLYVSDDGSTFTLQKTNILDEGYIANLTPWAGADGGYPTNISVAATNNGVVLLIDLVRANLSVTYRNTLLQYYSVDGGFSFTRLLELDSTTANDTEMGSLHKVVALPDSSFLVAYVALKSSADDWLYQKKLRSILVPFDDIAGELVFDVSNYGSFANAVLYQNKADLDIKISQDNYLYLVYAERSDQNLSNYGRLGLLVSRDFGETWQGTNNSLISGNLYTSTLHNPDGEVEVYLNSISFVPVGASLYVQAVAAGDSIILYPGNTALISLECGGWSSITRPYFYNAPNIHQQTAYDYSYFPFIYLFTHPAWTAGMTGTAAMTVVSDVDDCPYLKLTTGSPGTHTNVYAKSVTQNSKRTISLLDVKVVDGRADFEFYQSSTLGNFSAAYRVRVTETQLIVSSLNIFGTITTTLFTESLPNPGGRHQIYVGIDEDASDDAQTVIYVGIRAHDPTTDRAFAWTEYSSLGENKLTLASKTQLEYNVLGASSEIHLYGIQIGWGDNGITVNNTLELTKSGRLFSDKNVYAGKNVSIHAYGGPTYIGDEWTIDPVYDYGLANLFEEGSPSPNVPWRATDDSEQNIIFRLSDYGDDASMMSKAMGVFFYNANFEKAEIYGSNTSGAGAWTLLDTIEANSGFEELSWIRKGDVIRPPAEDLSPSVPYIPMNALIGSTFYDNAEDASGKILANTEGVWIEGDLNVTPRIKIGTVSDPISAEQSGAGYIWIKDFGAIINNLSDYEYIRIRIPACTTADGYISLGALVVGNVHYLGRRHGRQRTISREANVQTTTLRSGAKRTRVLGPTRRELTFSWANENEVDETQLYTSDLVDPDYISIGGIPQNTVAGTGKLIEGIIEELQGEHGLVTYVSNVPSNGSIKPFSFLRGRIVSSYNEDVVLGNEMDNELKRVSSVTISEEV